MNRVVSIGSCIAGLCQMFVVSCVRTFVALPSDHNALVSIFFREAWTSRESTQTQNGCGRWYVPHEVLEKAAQLDTFQPIQDNFRLLCQEFGCRQGSRKYKDPEEIKDLLRQRRLCANPEERTILVQRIGHARLEAKKQHKLDLLEAARQ